MSDIEIGTPVVSIGFRTPQPYRGNIDPSTNDEIDFGRVVMIQTAFDPQQNGIYADPTTVVPPEAVRPLSHAYLTQAITRTPEGWHDSGGIIWPEFGDAEWAENVRYARRMFH